MRLGASRTASWSSQESSWSAFGPSQKPQETSKSAPRAPRRFQDAPRHLQDPQEASKRPPRCLQDAPKMFLGVLWRSKNGDFASYICQKSGFLAICFQDAPKTPRKPSGAILEVSWSVWERLLELPGTLLECFWNVPEASRDVQEHPKSPKTLPRRLKTLPRPPGNFQKALKMPPRGLQDDFGTPLEEQKW